MRIQGVITTGIYCRSDCAANPLPKNVVPFPTAAAAEAAGFRACLRCRPWRLPSPALVDAPETVGSALVLISEGFMDTHTIEELACRVHLSSRQLRRDFLAAVGATPDAVARSRRAHFARRLLDETDLPIIDVGLASGFRSVRQFNRVMLSVFRAPPQELRARRRRGDLLATDGGIRLRIPCRGPLPFATMLGYLRPRAIPGVESVEQGVYRRTTRVCGYPGVIEVRDRGDGEHLEITAHLPSFAALMDEVAQVRRLFGADIDTTPAATHLAGEPALAPLVGQNPGLRLPGAWDRFETGVRILLGQQVSVPAATTLAGRLAERYGDPIDLKLPGGLSYCFPPAARIAEADDLATIGLPAARARSIQAFARGYAEGSLSLAGEPSLDAIVEALVDMPGIGPWSAQLMAARVYGHPDAFPASDLGLRQSAARLLGRESALEPCALANMAEAWRPYRSTAAAHLWLANLHRTPAAGVA